MQLKRKRGLKRALLASSCALLGTSARDALADAGDWNFDAGLLYYTEVGGITAKEPVLLAKRDFGDDVFLKLNLVVDALTGATPTGGMPSSKPQTVTGPSGINTTSQRAGVTPMDGNFRDTRKAITVTWDQPFAGQWHWEASAAYSIEHDFKSQGASTLFARDFDRRNTTVSAGVAYEHDDVFPIGGIPEPLSEAPQVLPMAADRSKTVKSMLLGLSQVMSHDWVAKLNFSYGDSDGYLNDPYKVVSIINTHLGGKAGLPGFPGGPGGGFGPPLGEPIGEIYENRPGSRHEKALYLDNRVAFAGDMLSLAYRYAWDDWGIHSNMLELRYRWAFAGDYYLQPHLRWYRQSAADFYHRGLLDSDAIPTDVSADYRLAAFTGRTLGLEFGAQLAGTQTFSVRIEHYSQGGGSDPHVEVGEQTGYDLFPGLSADIVQVDFTF
ncbi:MAG TPA: DUF3570 domain-containing protein [Gammaproteobacteria bacterium]|jgi:hypothetical protein|nr:DUF3570 domain-containing protein [Gammaproteobacteria bacterium]